MYMEKIKVAAAVVETPRKGSFIAGLAFAAVALPWIAIRVFAHFVVRDVRLGVRALRACGEAVADARR